MSKSIIGNWFIFVKEKYNYCISWMLRMLNVFWMKFNDVPDYFFFHVIFQIMWIDEKFYKLWSESPVIDAQRGVFVFKHQYDASVNYDMSQVLNCSPIHKLTYKNFDKMKLGMLMSDFINYVTSE